MNKQQAIASLKNDGLFVNWMSVSQRAVLKEGLNGEESAYFVDMLTELRTRIENMPKTYETDGQGDEAVAYLHYFIGSIDAWITEKDVCEDTRDVPRLVTDPAPPIANSAQLQAFGMQQISGEFGDAELGYISIKELIENGVELDLYWTPTKLKDIW